MPQENILTMAAARLAGIPYALSRRRPLHEPHKALILQTCCLSQVMLATPMLAALSEAFPKARFDWALSSWARPAVASNKRLTELVDMGETDLADRSWRQIGQLVLQLRAERYDTAFIPSGSALLSYIAWQAGIHQRIGLNIHGRGFAHTVPVTPPAGVTDRGSQGLLLAEAAGVDRAITTSVSMEFTPPDSVRTAATRRLIEEVDWLGDAPLIILHPGGGCNPRGERPLVRWPEERFALLGSYLAHAYWARLILVGAEDERALVQDLAGMLAAKTTNYCGRLGLNELAAFCEVADLYVGNDTGPSHVAAATGCRTLVIYGPTDPAISQPYTTMGNVRTVWSGPGQQHVDRPFSWDAGVTAEEVIKVADEMLQMPAERQKTMAILSRSRG